MSQHVAAIIQARLASTRLPNKVLARIGGSTVLEHVYHRVKAAIPTTIVAIPGGPANTALAEYCLTHNLDVWVHEGKEDDVLARYLGVAKMLRKPWLVRVTADCPLIDHRLLQAFVDTVDQKPIILKMAKKPLYASPAWPVRYVPHGCDFDVFTWVMVERCAAAATLAYDREHVSPWMRRYVEHAGHVVNMNTLATVDAWKGAETWRCVVDTVEDLAWFQMLASQLDFRAPLPPFADVYAFLRQRPELIRYE